jgi:hypothetical protein
MKSMVNKGKSNEKKCEKGKVETSLKKKFKIITNNILYHMIQLIHVMLVCFFLKSNNNFTLNTGSGESCKSLY